MIRRTAAGENAPRGRSLVFYLSLFGSLILLPSLIFSGFLIWQFTSAARQSTESKANETAVGLMQDVDRVISEMIVAQRILSRSLELERGDYKAFHTHATAALWGTDMYVILASPDGRQLLNTRVAYGTALGDVSDPSVRQVAESGETRVSNVFFGQVASAHAFNVLLPIGVDGKVRYVLIMTRNAESLVGVLRARRMPEGWTATLLDTTGRVIARNQDHARFVGQQVAAGASGPLVGIAATVPSIQAAVTSRLTGWSLRFSVPLAELESPLRRSWTLFAIVGGVLIGLSFMLVFLVARRVTGGLVTLSGAAERLGRGEPPQLVKFPVSEANLLGAALEQTYRELRARTAALRENEEHLRLSTEAGGLGTWERDLQTDRLKTSAAYRRMLGLAEDAAPATIAEMTANVVEEGRERIQKVVQHLIETGEPYEIEYRVELPDDGERWILSRGNLMVDEESGRQRVLGMVMDITERKEREAHVNFLMREMSHRAKNQLSVIQAMARQTARSSTDMDEFVERFGDRLQSLSRSTDLLLNENWRGAPIGSLLRSELSAFLDHEDSQVALNGEPLFVSTQATQFLGLALHELATNAAKYGALSVPEGHVDITWRVDRVDGPPQFRLSWVETGGPPVEKPTRRGFGSAVIEGLAARALNAEVSLDYAPEGLRWSISAPLSNIIGRPEPGAPGK